ncbi:hypothetical protein D3C84_832970 [compost metagenome]
MTSTVDEQEEFVEGTRSTEDIPPGVPEQNLSRERLALQKHNVSNSWRKDDKIYRTGGHLGTPFKPCDFAKRAGRCNLSDGLIAHRPEGENLPQLLKFWTVKER